MHLRKYPAADDYIVLEHGGQEHNRERFWLDAGMVRTLKCGCALCGIDDVRITSGKISKIANEENPLRFH